LGVLPRGLTLKEYEGAGASCAVLPGILQIAALTAQRSMLEELKATGSAQAFLAAQPYSQEMTRFYNQQGADELNRIESEYSG
jgi:2-methylisocitrate lyase-like PEP mutase family enzyme